MPQGSKQKYTDKQRRKAEHIEESMLERGYPRREAAGRAWATVNAIHHGGEKPGGGGYGKPEDKSVVHWPAHGARGEPVTGGGREEGRALALTGAAGTAPSPRA